MLKNSALKMTEEICLLRGIEQYSEVYNQNRQRTVECLLNFGARIDNIRVHPSLDWTPLALALNIDFGWGVLLDRGAILDEICLEEVGSEIDRGGTVALKFLLEVSDKNVDDNIRSK
jgi:hypothetical protein